jgi:hypothetical protein
MARFAGPCHAQKKRCTTETTEFTENNRSIFLCGLSDLCGEPSLGLLLCRAAASVVSLFGCGSRVVLPGVERV